MQNMKHGYTIGFDASDANVNNTDLGNYSRFIIDAVAASSPRHCYVRMYVGRREPNVEYDALDCRHNIESMEPDGSIWRKMPAIWRKWRMSKDAARGDVSLFHGLVGELPLGLARRKIRSVVTIHDLAPMRLTSYYNPLERAWYRIKMMYMLRTADRIVAVSDCVKRDLVSYMGVDPDKIDVIYRGCNPLFMRKISDEQLSEVANRYNLPKRYILSVGTQSERKNLRLIIEAMSQLPADVELVVVGRATSNTSALLHRIKSLGLESRVKMLYGVATQDLPAIYRQAELFVYPSLYDGFATPIIEALTVGVPVVATTGSSLEEAGGANSIYVPVDDYRAMAEALCRVLGDESLREQMSRSGREYASRFRSEVVAYNLLNCYRRIGIDLTE